jgi:hypothetical protein
MTSIKLWSRLSALTLGVVVLAAGQVTAGVVELASDRFGYSGTYTKYDTKDDALNGTNSVGTGLVNQRDLSLFIAKDSPNFYTDSTYILTAWYYTTTNSGPGYGNASNTNLSFLQIANDPAAGLAPLIGTADAYWTSPALNEFHISASGANANGSNSAARFGDQDAANKAASATAGTFLSYNLDATFSGLNTAVYNPITGAYESTGDPDGISVNGTFTALFQNTSTTNPASNGFYAINLTLNTTNWAYDNRADLQGQYQYSDSLFGASNVVPEPSSVVLAGLGVLGVLVHARRRRRDS